MIIDGKALAAGIRSEIARKVAMLTDRGVRPGLAVVLAGDDPASRVYVRNKVRACEETGVRSWLFEYPGSASEIEILGRLAALNSDRSVHGILVQLPLPAQMNATRLLETIAPAKDVDGFHPMNAGRLSTGLPALTPCTPLGCVMLAKTVHRSLEGMHAVIEATERPFIIAAQESAQFRRSLDQIDGTPVAPFGYEQGADESRKAAADHNN